MENRHVCRELADGQPLSFPAAKYPLLANAPSNLLEKAALRLNGLALRWEELDEDIWLDDAALSRRNPDVVASRQSAATVIGKANGGFLPKAAMRRRTGRSSF